MLCFKKTCGIISDTNNKTIRGLIQSRGFDWD